MAAGPNITTLRRVLSQPKPFVPCKTKACKNTRGAWPDFRADTITVWDDFNLDNLNESYGHILDLDVPEQRLAAPIEPGQVLAAAIEIAKPDDIRHLIRWNDKVIGPTLDFAREHLNLHDGVFLRHKISAPDNSAFARINDGRRPVRVDHFIALDEYPLSNLVIGLGRPSSKASFWPLRQLANLCDIAKTRYGRNAPNSTWKVALMPIPCSRTDLALWWLSMLAMSAPQHRTIVGGGEEIISINEWEVRYLDDDERGWVRRHRYSNFEEPADPPPPPPVYRSPSPGGNVAANAAAFAAQVGINADPLFNLDATADASFDDFDIDAYLNPAGAGNAIAANLGDSNVINPAGLNAANTRQG
ncbi:hypothetical protein QBC46DRAFT_361700 [Diplogelasinospora grovesii]|uniref:Uncharacterized protein n=1 Tax=Diplogelasinospora grovesii TaxID=303347 RepID=A0AAN6S8H3_9PEZI|nr:hypothetical protein QBC46DRAFT_361700 [Diplogelasinospora grovesii]